MSIPSRSTFCFNDSGAVTRKYPAVSSASVTGACGCTERANAGAVVHACRTGSVQVAQSERLSRRANTGPGSATSFKRLSEPAAGALAHVIMPGQYAPAFTKSNAMFGTLSAGEERRFHTPDQTA